MIIDQILRESKSTKINLFLDMDGTVVEFDCDTQNLRNTIGTNYYTNKRPLMHVINNIKKLANNKNIELNILSNCPLREQKEQKIAWIKKFMPFIKPNNIHLICYEETSFSKDEKPYLKGRFIKSIMKEGEKYYLIDDDYNNLVCTNSFDGIVAYHATTLVD